MSLVESGMIISICHEDKKEKGNIAYFSAQP